MKTLAIKGLLRIASVVAAAATLTPSATGASLSGSEFFTVDGLKYATEHYLDAVTLVGVEDEGIETIKVPETVTRESDGKVFPVVKIGVDYNKIETVNTFASYVTWEVLCKLPNLKTVDLSDANKLESIGYYDQIKYSGKSYSRVAYAFCDNPNLTEVIFPSKWSLKSIICSFNNTGLQELDLPYHLDEVKGKCFNDNANLKSVRIKSELEMPGLLVSSKNESPFGGCSIDDLVIFSLESPLRSSFPAKRKFMPFQEYRGATNAADIKWGDSDAFLLIDNCTAVQPVVKVFGWDFQSYAVPFAEKGPNPYTIDNLYESDSNGRCYVSFSERGDRQVLFRTEELDVLPVTLNAMPYVLEDDYSTGLDSDKVMKRSASLLFQCRADDSFDKSKLTVVVAETGETLYAEDIRTNYSSRGGYRFQIDNLTPNTKYNISLYFGDKHMCDLWFRTKGILLDYELIRSGVTTVRFKNGFKKEAGDEVEKEYVLFDGKEYPGGELELTGLAPNTNYKVWYYVVMKDCQAYTSCTIGTHGDLELTTLNPKVVSRSTVVVAAQSNLSESETHAGLEWRKIDAPEEIPSKSVNLTPIDGVMEGRIENLDASSYYKVRAFYETYDKSRRWYGEWIGFDPSDFSYFVPTVRTYESVAAEADHAEVKGYVLAGTDEVVSRGFEYWIETPAQAKPGVRAAAEVKTVTVNAEGQVFTAVLPGLHPDTQYRYRSFAKTAKETTYGEERTFRTLVGSSSAQEMEAEETPAEITGYYDLNGNRHEAPVRGINIVIYSDGSAKKLILR